MESGTSITRKKKRYTESAMVDRISALPDELLSHILSFLPTKLAFTTTVLSKRWSPLCYLLPFLRFNKHWERDYENTCNAFCRFVDTLMLSPLSTNQPLKIFSLKYSFRACERHNHLIKAWLEAANRRRVEEIHLTLNNYTSLNPIIFISRNLVVLKLEKLRIASDTSCVDLPSLITLHLEFVEFENHNNYINFLYGCPSLQDLYAKPIYLYREMNHDENNVTDKGLRSLTLSKLVRATLRPTDIVVFNAIENVEFLSIITKSSNAEANFKVIPIFQNLIQIDLEFFGDSFCWDSVVELLRHSPKLQLLFIKTWMKNRSSKEWKCPISILECVSSHLRSCTILNLEGSASDLGFATYILQNASHLQDMTIGITNYGTLLEKSQIIEELSSCARIFSGAKVSFECNFSY